MNFDKNTVLAIVLIGIIIIFMQTDFYKERFLPPQPKPSVEETSTPEKHVESITPESVTEAETENVKRQVIKASPSGFETLIADGEDVTVETSLYKAVFSTKGATVKSWELKKYKNQIDMPVQLVGKNGNGNLGIVLPTLEDTLDTSPFVFSVNKKSLILDERHGTQSLEFTLDLGDGKFIKKTFTFYQDKYDFGLKLDLINLENFIDGYYYYLIWSSGMESNEPNLKTDMQSAKGYVLQGDKDDFSISDEYKQERFDNPTDWVGIRTKYFASAVIPKTNKGKSVHFEGTPINVGKDVPLIKYSYKLQMSYNQKAEKEDKFVVYMGPLDYDVLTKYDARLEAMMDLGWAPFRPFAKFILWSFKLIHQVIPNYGVVILIFSVLIKIVLFPLTKKSYQSMKQMQVVQPLMTEMNEKYKDDPQKKQQEMMNLYRNYGINPLGGCIPMLLQMPLLIALFNIFRSTIELRGAYFVWWITDLSQPDTIATLPFSLPMYGNTVNILPLFMGITMFIQQKISMKDPKQKAMVYFMPIFLTLMFNSFPSGLNLYYALFNLLSIMQEKLVPYKIKTLEELKQEKVAKAKKRRTKYDYRRR